MVVDAVLWVLLAAAIAFIALGCRATRRRRKEPELHFQESLDQAA